MLLRLSLISPAQVAHLELLTYNTSYALQDTVVEKPLPSWLDPHQPAVVKESALAGSLFSHPVNFAADLQSHPFNLTDLQSHPIDLTDDEDAAAAAADDVVEDGHLVGNDAPVLVDDNQENCGTAHGQGATGMQVSTASNGSWVLHFMYDSLLKM